MATEKELINRLTEIEVELKIARGHTIDLRKQLLDAETSVIGLNIEKYKTTEQLRELQERTVSYEISSREKEIKKFKEVLPELLKKI